MRTSTEVVTEWGFVAVARWVDARQGRRERAYRQRYVRDRGRRLAPRSAARRLKSSPWLGLLKGKGNG